MMYKRCFVVALLVFSLFLSFGNVAPVEAEELTKIRVALWWTEGDDPTYRDPVTGEYPDTMPTALRDARLKALETVKEKLNVELEFVQYALPVEQQILQTVLAGDPIAEIVGMWAGSQGVILNQNVLQDLTPYKECFGEEAFWMLGSMDLYGKVLGFSLYPVAGFPVWPLLYNIDYLKECTTLEDGYADEDGNIILPSQLWEQGRWDWDTFKDYLSKVKAYYYDQGRIGGDRGRVIHAYEEDYRQAYNYLLSANGEFIVRTDGTIGVNSEAGIETIEFLQDLMREGIMWAETYDDGYTPGWTWNGNNFSSGEAVFTSMPGWLMDGAVSSFTARGEEIGIVPFPIGPKAKANPDQYPYHVPFMGGDTLGIPKGIDEETAKLAIRTWAMYNAETYKNLGHANTQDYIDSQNELTAVKYFPVAEERYGESLVTAYGDWINNSMFDSGEMLGVVATLHDTVAQLIANPSSNARTRIEEEMPKYEQAISGLRRTLEGDAIVDNQAPVVNLLEGKELVFEVGTDLTQTDWTAYFEAYDIGQDKSFSIEDVVFGYDKVDNTDANNTSRLVLSAADQFGNETTVEHTVIFYNPDKEEKPVIELVTEDEIQFDLDYNISSVTWTDYVNAYDKIVLSDGTVLTGESGEELTFDLNSRLEADVSQLDVSTPGIYPITFGVKDYAGNEATLEITVEVVVPEDY